MDNKMKAWIIFLVIMCVLLECSCAVRSYPTTGSACKAQKDQQSRLKSQFP